MLLWLEPDEVLCLPRVARGFTVGCERGAALLTQAGDQRDHILTPGSGHVLPGRGKVTVWASENCALRLETPSPRRTLGLRWREALRAPETGLFQSR